MEQSPHESEGASASSLSLEGAVTASAAAALKDVACGQLRVGGDITVSCARLEQIDLAGLQLLLALRRGLAEDGRTLELQEVPPHLERTFLLAGLLPLPRAPGREQPATGTSER